jgi:acid phosphatase type 7
MLDRTKRARGKIALPAVLALLGAAASAPVAEAKTAPLIAAAGDIACGPNNPRYNGGQGVPGSCQQYATSELLGGRRYSAILTLGDTVYDDNGSLASYYASFHPSWGRFLGAIRPVIGNHEYDDGLGAQGYWDYFNGVGAGTGRAGVRGRGWYAYNVGSWRLIALNSNCDFVACARTSRQIRFLEHELERHPDRCVLAYLHHARFTSGLYEERGRTRAIWKALYRGGADVVLNGHDHIYERFAPQRPSGVLDWRNGITQFTVGTGGYFLFPVGVPANPNSQFTFNGDFGILNMRLGRKAFIWSFVTARDRSVIDGGKRRCHRE